MLHPCFSVNHPKVVIFKIDLGLMLCHFGCFGWQCALIPGALVGSVGNSQRGTIIPKRSSPK